jgi:hypothetical protein
MIIFVCVCFDVMCSGEYNVFDVTLSVYIYPHREGWKVSLTMVAIEPATVSQDGLLREMFWLKYWLQIFDFIFTVSNTSSFGFNCFLGLFFLGGAKPILPPSL